MSRDYSEVVKKIDSIALKVYNDLQKPEIPNLKLPTRAKSNIEFDDKLNVWKYGSNRIERSAKSLDGDYN